MKLNGILFLLQIVVTLYAASGACPDGWTSHDAKCYLVVHESYSWFDAQEACRILRGTLAEPRTPGENQYLVDLLHSRGISESWIGLEDIVEERTYVWTSDLSRMLQSHWDGGEPDDRGGQEDCAAIRQSSGRWFDDHCSAHPHPAVCQLENEEPILG